MFNNKQKALLIIPS